MTRHPVSVCSRSHVAPSLASSGDPEKLPRRRADRVPEQKIFRLLEFVHNQRIRVFLSSEPPKPCTRPSVPVLTRIQDNGASASDSDAEIDSDDVTSNDELIRQRESKQAAQKQRKDAVISASLASHSLASPASARTNSTLAETLAAVHLKAKDFIRPRAVTRLSGDPQFAEARRKCLPRAELPKISEAVSSSDEEPQIRSVSMYLCPRSDGFVNDCVDSDKAPDQVEPGGATDAMSYVCEEDPTMPISRFARKLKSFVVRKETGFLDVQLEGFALEGLELEECCPHRRRTSTHVVLSEVTWTNNARVVSVVAEVRPSRVPLAWRRVLVDCASEASVEALESSSVFGEDVPLRRVRDHAGFSLLQLACERRDAKVLNVVLRLGGSALDWLRPIHRNDLGETVFDVCVRCDWPLGLRRLREALHNCYSDSSVSQQEFCAFADKLQESLQRGTGDTVDCATSNGYDTPDFAGGEKLEDFLQRGTGADRGDHCALCSDSRQSAVSSRTWQHSLVQPDFACAESKPDHRVHGRQMQGASSPMLFNRSEHALSLPTLAAMYGAASALGAVVEFLETMPLSSNPPPGSYRQRTTNGTSRRVRLLSLAAVNAKTRDTALHEIVRTLNALSKIRHLDGERRARNTLRKSVIDTAATLAMHGVRPHVVNARNLCAFSIAEVGIAEELRVLFHPNKKHNKNKRSKKGKKKGKRRKQVSHSNPKRMRQRQQQQQSQQDRHESDRGTSEGQPDLDRDSNVDAFTEDTSQLSYAAALTAESTTEHSEPTLESLPSHPVEVLATVVEETKRDIVLVGEETPTDTIEMKPEPETHSQPSKDEVSEQPVRPAAVSTPPKRSSRKSKNRHLLRSRRAARAAQSVVSTDATDSMLADDAVKQTVQAKEDISDATVEVAPVDQSSAATEMKERALAPTVATPSVASSKQRSTAQQTTRVSPHVSPRVKPSVSTCAPESTSLPATPAASSTAPTQRMSFAAVLQSTFQQSRREARRRSVTEAHGAVATRERSGSSGVTGSSGATTRGRSMSNSARACNEHDVRRIGRRNSVSDLAQMPAHYDEDSDDDVTSDVGPHGVDLRQHARHHEQRRHEQQQQQHQQQYHPPHQQQQQHRQQHQQHQRELPPGGRKTRSRRARRREANLSSNLSGTASHMAVAALNDDDDRLSVASCSSVTSLGSSASVLSYRSSASMPPPSLREPNSAPPTSLHYFQQQQQQQQQHQHYQHHPLQHQHQHQHQQQQYHYHPQHYSQQQYHQHALHQYHQQSHAPRRTSRRRRQAASALHQRSHVSSRFHNTQSHRNDGRQQERRKQGTRLSRRRLSAASVVSSHSSLTQSETAYSQSHLPQQQHRQPQSQQQQQQQQHQSQQQQSQLRPSDELLVHQTKMFLEHANVNEKINAVIDVMRPRRGTRRRFNEVHRFVERLVQAILSDKVRLFPMGSVALRTFLVDSDIDLTLFGHAEFRARWAREISKWLHRIVEHDLQAVALASDAADVAADPALRGLFAGEETQLRRILAVLREQKKISSLDFTISDPQLIDATVALVKMRVGNTDVDVTSGRHNALVAGAFFEEIDRRLGNDHLFKRSLLLCKAFFRHLGSVLGSDRGLLSSYCLRTFVLTVFNLWHHVTKTPLECLHRLLWLLSSFDWDHCIFTIQGPLATATAPVAVHSLSSVGDDAVDDGGSATRDVATSTSADDTSNVANSREGWLQPSSLVRVPLRSSAEVAPEPLIDDEFLSHYARPPKSHDRGYQLRDINVMDPLDATNNLARPVRRSQDAMLIKRKFQEARDVLVRAVTRWTSLSNAPPSFHVDACMLAVGELLSVEMLSTLLSQCQDEQHTSDGDDINADPLDGQLDEMREHIALAQRLGPTH
ncbi:MAG: hypothetical protein MHM6MM_001541 [Cercozoa sp. M6MM]